MNRLGRILAEDWRGPRRERRLDDYGRGVLQELAWVDEITGTCFACFDRFEVLATVTMLYFAAAVWCEVRERKGQAGPDEAFLLTDDTGYRQIAAAAFRQAPTLPASGAAAFAADVVFAVMAMMDRRKFLATLPLLWATLARAAPSGLPQNRNIKWALSLALWRYFPPCPFTEILAVMQDTGFIGIRVINFHAVKTISQGIRYVPA